MSTAPYLACLVVAAVTAGCSRQPPENPATPNLQTPTVATVPVPPPLPLPEPPTVASPSASSSARGRSIPLRQIIPASDIPPATALDVMPGSLPGADHPAGTAFVAMFADDDAVHVTEWDLASGVALHDTKLDLPAWGLRFVQTPGPSVRIMASAYNGPLVFVQLTRALKVVTRQEVGFVSVLGPNGFAGDLGLTAILADGMVDPTRSPKADSGLFAMSFDAVGNHAATRLLERDTEDGGTSSPMMNDNLAVLGGHVYVALVDAAYRLRVLRLTRDLRTERERRLPLPASFSNPQAKLLAEGGHLVLDLPDSLDLLELPLDLDLAHVAHRPRPASLPPFPGDAGGERCGPPRRFASELLALCNCGKQTCLSWAPLPP
jgi:hypothetical protein